MSVSTTHKLEEWRRLAADLRVDATRATLPGFAEKLLRAAKDLEHYADGLSDRDSAA